MKRKVLVMILAVLLPIFCALSGVVVWLVVDDRQDGAYSSWSGSGTSSSPYLIATASDLETLETNVAAGTTYSGIYFKQTAHIDMADSSLTRIGNGSYFFQGNYNGNGYKITDLTLTAGSTQYYGLFGRTNGATIRNVTLEGTTLTSSYYYTGCLVGYAYNSTIRNCKVLNCSVTGGEFIGGIAGYAATTTIEDCLVTGSISGTTVGGIVGKYYNSSQYNYYIDDCVNQATITAGTSQYAGGIVGHGTRPIIRRCWNDGRITRTSSYYTGGIAGYVAGYSSSYYANITESFNSATITGYSHTGGLVGGFGTYVNMTHSYNSGAVTATSNYTGGLVGYVSGGSTRGSISCCYNKGVVTGTSTVGGLFGYFYGSDLSYSYNVGKTTSSNSGSNIGAIFGNYNSSYTTLTGNYWQLGTASYAYGTTSYTTGISNATTLNASSPSWSLYTNGGWSIGTTWVINESNDKYPIVKSIYWSGSGSGSVSDPFLVSDANDLKEIHEKTVVGISYTQMTFKQTESFAVSSINSDIYNNWTPIGYEATDFDGTYDGNGFAISNLKLKHEDYNDNIGLFSELGTNSVIKNLGVTNATIVTTDSSQGNIGILAGSLGYWAEIKNCYTTGTMTCSSSRYVGGLIGYAKTDSTIEGSYSSATISGAQYTGGIVGYIVGGMYSCYFAGSVTGTTDVGGIAGRISYSSSSGVLISSCYNIGSVTGTSKSAGGIAGSTSECVNLSDCYNAGVISGKNYVGGIVGQAISSNTSYSEFLFGYNKGSVSGTSYVGGLFGNGEKITARFMYNLGKISATSYAGGLFGTNTSCFISTTELKWDADCGASYYSGDYSSTVGKTSDLTTLAKSQTWEFYSLYTNYSWDFSNVWLTSADKNDGHPTLKSFIYSGAGAGTESNPFLVSSVEELQDIQVKTNTGVDYTGLYFKQTVDLDLTSIGDWTPIGTSSSSFKGIYDGAGFAINNLKITNTTDYKGLFGYAESATLKGIKITNVSISAGAADYVGAILGYGVKTYIKECVVQSGTVAGTQYVGGIVGRGTGANLSDTEFIKQCYNSATITGTSSYIGGIAGGISGYFVVTDCYNTGAVTSSSSCVGGIVGDFQGISASGIVLSWNTHIKSSYNRGKITGTGSVGGIFGRAASSLIAGSSTHYYTAVSYCYNIGTLASTTSTGAIGGTCSTSYMSSSSNYFDSDCGATYAFGSASSNSGTTSNSSIDSTTYAKNSSWTLYTGYWDFTDIWRINSSYNSGYPTFVWTMPKRTITFNANGGSGTVASVTDYYSKYVTLPTNTFTRDGYVANGWVTSTAIKSTPTYADGASIQCDTMILYANWTPIGMTTTFSVYVEEDIDGNTYDKISAKVSGLTMQINYYTMTLSGNATSSNYLYVYGTDDKVTMRTYQTMGIYISAPSGYICTAVEVDGVKTTYTDADQRTWKRFSIQTGLSGYDSSNYQGTVKIYIKNVSGNQLEYE